MGFLQLTIYLEILKCVRNTFFKSIPGSNIPSIIFLGKLDLDPGVIFHVLKQMPPWRFI